MPVGGMTSPARSCRTTPARCPPKLPAESFRRIGNRQPAEKNSVPKGYEKAYGTLRYLGWVETDGGVAVGCGRGTRARPAARPATEIRLAHREGAPSLSMMAGEATVGSPATSASARMPSPTSSNGIGQTLSVGFFPLPDSTLNCRLAASTAPAQCARGAYPETRCHVSVPRCALRLPNESRAKPVARQRRQSCPIALTDRQTSETRHCFDRFHVLESAMCLGGCQLAWHWDCVVLTL